MSFLTLNLIAISPEIYSQPYLRFPAVNKAMALSDLSAEGVTVSKVTSHLTFSDSGLGSV